MQKKINFGSPHKWIIGCNDLCASSPSVLQLFSYKKLWSIASISAQLSADDPVQKKMSHSIDRNEIVGNLWAIRYINGSPVYNLHFWCINTLTKQRRKFNWLTPTAETKASGNVHGTWYNRVYKPQITVCNLQYPHAVCNVYCILGHVGTRIWNKNTFEATVTITYDRSW